MIIPNSVTSIGYAAFLNCENLTSVIISDSVTSIWETAFGGSGLISVTIPNLVTSVDDNVTAGAKVGDLNTEETFTYAFVDDENFPDNASFTIMDHALTINKTYGDSNFFRCYFKFYLYN